MIKTLSDVTFEKNSDYYVWATHTFYDTSVDTLRGPVIKQYRRLNIQWHNIWATIRAKLTPQFKRLRVAQFAYAGVTNEPLWMKYYRFAIALVGSPYLNDDWVALGDAEQTGTHTTITTITIASVNGSGADILVARTSADGAKTMSATFNSVSLTSLASITTNRSVHIQYLGSPAQSAQTYVGTFSSADNGFGILTMYSGTAGTMSGGTTGQANATSTSGQGETVTTTSGDVAVDVLAIGTAATGHTIGAGQTQRGTDTSDGWYHEFRASDETATGTSVTMSWSWTSSANFAHASGCINQASAGTVTAKPKPSLLLMGVG